MYEKLNQRVRGKIYKFKKNGIHSFVKAIIKKDGKLYHSSSQSELVEIDVDVISVEWINCLPYMYFIVFKDKKDGYYIGQYTIEKFCLDKYFLDKTGQSIQFECVKILTDIDYSCKVCKSFYKLNQILSDFTCYGCKMS